MERNYAMGRNLDDIEPRDPLDPPQPESESSTGTAGDDVVDEDVQEIRIEIEQTRSEMSETIDAIQEKLSPENIAQQATETVREATIGRAQQAANQAADRARVTGGTVTEALRQNRTQLLSLIGPVTSVLMVLLILWRRRSAEQEVVEVESTPRRSPFRRGTSQLPPAAATAGMALDRARGTLATVAGQGQAAARQAAAQARQTAGQAREAAAQAGAGARRVALRQRAQTPPPSTLDRLRSMVSNTSGRGGGVAGQLRTNVMRFVLRQQAPPPPQKPVDRIRNTVANAASQAGSVAAQARAQAQANAMRLAPRQQAQVETPATSRLDQLRSTMANAVNQGGNAARQVGDQARTTARRLALQQQEPDLPPAPPPPPQPQMTVTTVRQAVEQNPATTVVALVAVVLAVLARFMDRSRRY